MSGAVPTPPALRLAVLVPAFQAAATLPDVLARLARVHAPADTWVIDDGSRDGTEEVARAAGVRVEVHATNRGKGAGLLTGFRATAGYDAIATIDADGQHKPEDLPRLVGALAHADLVVGARVRTGAMPPHRRLGNRLSAAFLTWLAGTTLPDVQSGYRVHRASVLVALGLQPPVGAPRGGPAPPAFRSTGYGFESEILIAAARLGFRVTDVPIEAVYAGAPSHFHPWRELPRFASLYTRLLVDARSWSAHRHRQEERMNILVTNDDGITSTALYGLRDALADLGRVFIVAPDRDQSATSHSLTLYRPMRIENPEPDVYAVDGTPTDCVLAATHGLLSEPIDLVVSGVDRGPNMGDDVFYSGTVAAAIEGAMQGVPAIAVSLVVSGLADFSYACAFTRRLVDVVRREAMPAKSVLNVNVPNLPAAAIAGVEITRLGKRIYQDALIERTDPRGRKYYWIGGDAPVWEPEPESDFLAVDRGYVSVTPLHLVLTDEPLRERLAGWRLTP